MSMEAIGNEFGRDHSTVVYSINTMERNLQKDRHPQGDGGRHHQEHPNVKNPKPVRNFAESESPFLGARVFSTAFNIPSKAP